MRVPQGLDSSNLKPPNLPTLFECLLQLLNIPESSLTKKTLRCSLKLMCVVCLFSCQKGRAHRSVSSLPANGQRWELGCSCNWCSEAGSRQNLFASDVPNLTMPIWVEHRETCWPAWRAVLSLKQASSPSLQDTNQHTKWSHWPLFLTPRWLLPFEMSQGPSWQSRALLKAGKESMLSRNQHQAKLFPAQLLSW